MMSSPSFSYGESVLSHLEKVQELPAEVQAEIAGGVDNYIKFARTAKDNALLARIASMAMEEHAKAIGQGAKQDGPAMGGTGHCRGVVLCHAQSVGGVSGSIACGSDHWSN
jgi:hypothetical protein